MSKYKYISKYLDNFRFNKTELLLNENGDDIKKLKGVKIVLIS